MINGLCRILHLETRTLWLIAWLFVKPTMFSAFFVGVSYLFCYFGINLLAAADHPEFVSFILGGIFIVIYNKISGNAFDEAWNENRLMKRAVWEGDEKAFREAVRYNISPVTHFAIGVFAAVFILMVLSYPTGNLALSMVATGIVSFGFSFYREYTIILDNPKKSARVFFEKDREWVEKMLRKIKKLPNGEVDGSDTKPGF